MPKEKQWQEAVTMPKSEETEVGSGRMGTGTEGLPGRNSPYAQIWEQQRKIDLASSRLHILQTPDSAPHWLSSTGP